MVNFQLKVMKTKNSTKHTCDIPNDASIWKSACENATGKWFDNSKYCQIDSVKINIDKISVIFCQNLIKKLIMF